MVAGYIDLPKMSFSRFGPFAPFVGAGMGVVRTQIGQTRMTFPATTIILGGS